MTFNNRPTLDLFAPRTISTDEIEDYINHVIDEVLLSVPDINRLSPDESRGIIARYTAVLEGNFIYWMTATYLSVHSEQAHSIIEDNLREEVRDNHPGMLRRFAVAAGATSKDADRLAIDQKLQRVRTFVSKLCPLRMVLMMAFLEGFIARFMPYLADLAAKQGSSEMEYTDVHGVVDVAHTQGLFLAFSEESPFSVGNTPTPLFEGVDLLRDLIASVIHP